MNKKSTSQDNRYRIGILMNASSLQLLKEYYENHGKSLNLGMRLDIEKYIKENLVQPNSKILFDPFFENTDDDRKKTTVFMDHELYNQLMKFVDSSMLTIQKIVEKALYPTLTQLLPYPNNISKNEQ